MEKRASGWVKDKNGAVVLQKGRNCAKGENCRARPENAGGGT